MRQIGFDCGICFFSFLLDCCFIFCSFVFIFVATLAHCRMARTKNSVNRRMVFDTKFPVPCGPHCGSDVRLVCLAGCEVDSDDRRDVVGPRPAHHLPRRCGVSLDGQSLTPEALGVATRTHNTLLDALPSDSSMQRVSIANKTTTLLFIFPALPRTHACISYVGFLCFFFSWFSSYFQGCFMSDEG